MQEPVYHIQFKNDDTEDKARAFLEKIRWGNTATCFHCGGKNACKLNVESSGDGRKIRSGLYQCKNCRKQFTVTTGTIITLSHIELSKWIKAYDIIKFHPNITTDDLKQQLEVTYKTAYYVREKAREAMDLGFPYGMNKIESKKITKVEKEPIQDANENPIVPIENKNNVNDKNEKSEQVRQEAQEPKPKKEIVKKTRKHSKRKPEAVPDEPAPTNEDSDDDDLWFEIYESINEKMPFGEVVSLLNSYLSIGFKMEKLNIHAGVDFNSEETLNSIKSIFGGFKKYSELFEKWKKEFWV